MHLVAKETPTIVAQHLNCPNFPLLLQQFLYTQLTPSSTISVNDIPHSNLPPIHPNTLPLSIYHSAVSTFFAPSDLSGLGGMHHEFIHAVP